MHFTFLEWTFGDFLQNLGLICSVHYFYYKLGHAGKKLRRLRRMNCSWGDHSPTSSGTGVPIYLDRLKRRIPTSLFFFKYFEVTTKEKDQAIFWNFSGRDENKEEEDTN